MHQKTLVELVASTQAISLRVTTDNPSAETLPSVCHSQALPALGAFCDEWL